MARAEAILSVVQQVYDAALEPDGWTRALPSISEAFGGGHLILHTQNASGKTNNSSGGFAISPENLARFDAAVNASLAPAAMRAIPVGAAIRSSAWQSDRDFARSTFYNEAIRPNGSFYAAVASLLRTSDRHVFLIAARALGRDDYDAEDIASMEVLVPHLVAAMRVSDRLRAADLRTEAAYAALERLGTGVILIDAAGRILFANPAAESVLAANDGLSAGKEGLRAVDRDAGRVLGQLIMSCVYSTLVNGGPGGSVVVPRGTGRAPLHVLVAPARSETGGSEMAWLGASRPAAILVISDPDRERLTHKEQLQHRFGFTGAEADVALEILKGDGRDAAAARLDISMTTVRTHLSRIFEKTGVRRQAELVRLLMQGENKLTRE
jgi:DNA-binding CsgD family transcriptional regulator